MAGGRADRDHRLDHLVEAARVDGQHLRPAAQVPQRAVDGADVHGAHRTEVLGQDEVGVEVRQGPLVEVVEVLTGGDPSLDLGVDLRRLRPGVNAEVETIRRPRASAGKSHSNVTPTTSSPAPTAKQISVVDGSSDTIRTPVTLPSKRQPLDEPLPRRDHKMWCVAPGPSVLGLTSGPLVRPPRQVGRRKREPGASPGLPRSGERERPPSDALGHDHPGSDGH